MLAEKAALVLSHITSLISSYFPFQLDNGFLYYFPREFSTNGQLQKQLPLGWEITPGDDPNVEMHLLRALNSYAYSWLVLADGSGISGPMTPYHDTNHQALYGGMCLSMAADGRCLRAAGGTFAIEQKGHVVTVTDTSTNVGQPTNQTPIMFRPFSRHTPAESAMYTSHAVAAVQDAYLLCQESATSGVDHLSQLQGESFTPWGHVPPPSPLQFALLLRKKA